MREFFCEKCNDWHFIIHRAYATGPEDGICYECERATREEYE